MVKRLLILAFIIITASNSLAAVSPHIDGGGCCSMGCCEAAQSDEPVSLIARLCCKFDCNQPASTLGSSPAKLGNLTFHLQGGYCVVL